MIVTVHGDLMASTALCGPAGDDPRVVDRVDPTQAERLARAVLTEPDRNAAIRFVEAALGELTSELPGLRNQGMLASHELVSGVPARPDWAEACQKGKAVLDFSGQELVDSLGFTIEPRGSAVWVLRAKGAATAIAVFLDDAEAPEVISSRFGGATPSLTRPRSCRLSEGLPYVLLTRSNQIRLYGVRPNVGVGRPRGAPRRISKRTSLSCQQPQQATYHSYLEPKPCALEAPLNRCLRPQGTTP